MKNKSMKNNIPPEWVSLFKSVADLCDGIPYREMRTIIREDYEKIMKTKLGQQIYSGAISDRNKEFFW